ncbi:tetraacyldisaccharide 4'-kinase [Dechloromonas sp.]|uniref:tetraacyldisaccharide 4'-kinase n=1 Tax=Dechloromonas sp. TaxID=1917218 RepID=UPI001212D6C8|nr:tetraacyldisaccharide 4'-kinase [Dechloromonas sp.]MBU3695526.1 tetraacyldisaccharide 4'-kinase [Dechloromonas sp.]TEX48934.1 MAG: tetraacyldisaccharide 4'-kinase [Rhodocyclaceae bacterium]
MLARWLQRQWFAQRRLSPALWLLLPLLLPLHTLFCLVSGCRRRRTIGRRLPVPVVVVGNITVGGAGKTPLTLWLAQQLVARGRRPGIVSRGYGRQGEASSAVTPENSPKSVGDEPLLLARRSGVPVWVGRDRAAAGAALLAAHPEVDIVLCDDGLQHYKLARDAELAVFDGRAAGNGWRLPLGPLREPLSRLRDVDAVIRNGAVDLPLPPALPVFDMHLEAGDFYALGDPARRCTASALFGRKLHAMAGIGDPGRFFRTLSELGLQFEAHPFPDHHDYVAADLTFAGDGVLLMTEKDAVKCAGLTTGEAWVLPVEAALSPALIDLILEKLRGRTAA